MKISKLDVIDAHLQSAMQLIAIDGSPISTHVVVMACEEIIVALADHHGIVLPFDLRIAIKEEYLKQYNKLNRQAYNFAKHADKDPSDSLDGLKVENLRELNEMKTLLNISNYQAIGGQGSGAMTNYSLAILLKYPNLFKLEFLSKYPSIEAGIIENSSAMSRDPSLFGMAMRQVLHNERLLPRIPA